MKKQFLRIMSLLMTFLLLLSIFPLIVFADDSMIIAVSSEKALVGSEVAVTVSVKNNPGFVSLNFDIIYDNALTLTKITPSSDVTAAGGQLLLPTELNSPVNVFWMPGMEDYTNRDFKFVELTFSVKENVTSYITSEISISYDPENIYNKQTNNVDCKIENGGVVISPCFPGDIDGNNKVNSKDVFRLMQHIAKWDVPVNELVLDVNGDGKVNSKDVFRLMQYIAKWDVVIFPSSGHSEKCVHNMLAVEAKAPTCMEQGNSAYWRCTKCNNYYSDADGLVEVSPQSVLIPATGHTPILDSEPGKTEGSHCSVCGTVLVEPKPISGDGSGTLPEGTYGIAYHMVSEENAYLALQDITNPNPNQYESQKGLNLSNNVTAAGYSFVGWFDSFAENAEKIKSIPKGTEGTVELYAHWREVPYDVMFESDLIPVDGIKYTVSKGCVLPTPKLDGYEFIGWSDEDGQIYKTLPKGTTGHKVLSANWLSERNQAWAKNQLDDPIVYEDDEQVLFAYEIGEIRNVPLVVIEDFGKINANGVSKEVTKSYTTTTSKTEMSTYTNTVSKATTESFGWTLSKDWSDSVSVDEEWCQENGLSTEESEQLCTNDSNNWYVSSGASGSDTTVTSRSKDKYNLTTNTKNTKTYNTKETERRQDFSADLNNKLTLGMDVSAGAEIPIPQAPGAKVNVGATQKTQWEGSLDLKYSQGQTVTKKTGTEKDKGTQTQTGDVKHSSTTNTSSNTWNTESGYSGSSSVSKSQAVSKVLSEKISSKYGYGRTYITKEGQTQSQGLTSSDSSSDTYSSSVTYSVTGSETVSKTYSTSNTMSGYHRWVLAGTAHVFGVVGYDYASESFFVFTYSVMDDETHEFEDYSYDYASYDDNQNGVIPFEVPIDIAYFVANRICESDGLQISKAGAVTKYTGNDEIVIIPEYKVFSNRDGTSQVVKVTSFNGDVFSGKKIAAIELSEYMTEIPANAFKNCANLESVEAASLTKIGDNAFAGCPKLRVCAVGDTVESLGTNVFVGMESVTVNAANDSIVGAALQSGAKNLQLSISEKCKSLDDLTLNVPQSVDVFTFNGFGREYRNLSIESDAKQTVINRASLISSGKVPLKVSSDSLTLNEVTASAPGIALICTSDKTAIDLYGESYLTSTGAKANAMLCRKAVLGQIDDSYYSLLHINDNILMCGRTSEFEDNDLLKFDNESGRIISIDEDAFAKYMKGSFSLTFDPTGGTVSAENKTLTFGEKCGELPVPTRDYHDFDGWYTAQNDGEKVTADTVLPATGDVTLYARWIARAEGGWVKASNVPSGAKITSRKWTYDLTTRTTSSNPSLPGYTKYNETWVWGSWGNWSGWSTSYVGSSDSRQVETRSIPATYKTQWNYSRWTSKSNNSGYTGPWQGKWSGIQCNYYFERGWSDSPLSVWSSQWAGGTEFNLYGVRNNSWYNETTRQVEVTPAYTEYHFRDRAKVYTYYFYKVEAKESTSAVYASDTVSNVQEWVKYINK